MCTWSNTQNRDLDKLDWELTSRETEKHYSIPAEDHTLGTEKGHFLFFPSTNRTAEFRNAQLLSPHLPPTKGTCLKFWAHIPSSSNSLLKVYRLSEGFHQLMVVREVIGKWGRFQADITSAQEYQIVFEGIKGTSGFVALDDIEYTIGINCANQITDLQTSSKRVNTGGIVASVIVALLLVGTLIALLFYYLKTRQMMEPQTTLSFSSSSSSADVGFTNTVYDPEPMQNHVMVPPAQNHPMAAGFNHLNDDVREVEVA